MNILITGASSGIGYALRKLFKENGHTVISISRSENDEANNNYSCDITNVQETQNLFEKLNKKFSGLDILINNAGLGLFGATELAIHSAVCEQFSTHYFGVINFCHHALDMMQKGAKIINISSACALFPIPYRGHYCASKAALNMISKCMSMELKKFGIQVSAICPGEINTNFSLNRNVNLSTNAKHTNQIENAFSVLEKRNSSRGDAAVYALKIYKTINKKKLKPVVITDFKYRLLYSISKIMPEGLFLKVIKKLFIS